MSGSVIRQLNSEYFSLRLVSSQETMKKEFFNITVLGKHPGNYGREHT